MDNGVSKSPIVQSAVGSDHGSGTHYRHGEGVVPFPTHHGREEEVLSWSGGFVRPWTSRRPFSLSGVRGFSTRIRDRSSPARPTPADLRDRKSTRLNSSHLVISYAVFCLKKKNKSRISPSPSRPSLRTSRTV